MLCSVKDCGREARYKAACLCQKHYFRQRRYGTTETTKVGKGKNRYVMPDGYIHVRIPGHPLASKNGVVAEHRAVVYDDLGPGEMKCALCGVGVTWSTVHIDHIDNSTDNNARENLRPTCNACNTRRGRRPEHTYLGRTSLTHEGVTQTAHEWSKDPRVSVNGATIRRRLRDGMTDQDALFSPKRTHNGKPCRKTELRRSNANNLEKANA